MKTARNALALIFWIVAASVLSVMAVEAFPLAAHVFHSVPVARACDAIGRVILLPARGVFRLIGGADQTLPLAQPLVYACLNGTLLGVAGFLIARRFMKPG